ncbi:hypothetical protein FRX31_017966, partial [Thalictrum thalictroides]
MTGKSSAGDHNSANFVTKEELASWATKIESSNQKLMLDMQQEVKKLADSVEVLMLQSVVKSPSPPTSNPLASSFNPPPSSSLNTTTFPQPFVPAIAEALNNEYQYQTPSKTTYQQPTQHTSFSNIYSSPLPRQTLPLHVPPTTINPSPTHYYQHEIVPHTTLPMPRRTPPPPLHYLPGYSSPHRYPDYELTMDDMNLADGVHGHP